MILLLVYIYWGAKVINPNKELLKWGPIDGRPIYVDPFTGAFVKYPKFIGVSWPDVFGFVKDDKVVFIADYEKLRDSGEKLFVKHVLDDKILRKAFDDWMLTVNKFKEFEASVNKGISDLSDSELKNLFVEWDKAHLNFWLTGFLPELSNWGGERLLKNKILDFDKFNFIEIFEALGAPEDLSFFQTEELAFMKIKLLGKEKQLEKLKEHQQKYYWLRNSYGFTKVLDINFFKKELDKISKQDAEKKINEINNYVDKILQKKKDIIGKYNINEDIVKIARKLAYCVWWQDFRKQFIFIDNHIISCFMKEISKRKDIQFKELCYYCSYEIIELLENNKRINTKPRYNGFIMYYHENKDTSYLTGKKANDLVKPYLEVHVDKNLKEFKGLVVSKGKQNIVKGKARILLSPKNLDKMQKGDILVAPMTSPDYVIAMRKASAVVTDEGGMTSHAAIVSRELGLPCIVGTRIATKALKDGDLIEVDADKGVVRKLK